MLFDQESEENKTSVSIISVLLSVKMHGRLLWWGGGGGGRGEERLKDVVEKLGKATLT